MKRSRTILYPTLEEVLYIHRILIDKFGGTLGVRDLGLLESALARPRSGYYSSLSEQAAALLQSIALNHAFVDGNKRISFATMAIFLRMNGFGFEINAVKAEKFIKKDLIIKKCELSIITEWIEKHIVTI